MNELTAIIITFNEAKHIVDCIQALQFADDVLVIDSFSEDNTVELAEGAGARVIQNEFENFSAQRNFALDCVRDSTKWVLFVDADERVTEELAIEVSSVLHRDDVSGYQIPRHNYIFGKLTRGAGWYPDYQTRLLRVKGAKYDTAREVHEVVLLDGKTRRLNRPLVHYNYESAAQFHAKQRKYTQFEAAELYRQGIKPKLRNYLLQPLRHFYWRFIALKGYIDGWHGLSLSARMAWYEFVKYRMLSKMWRENKQQNRA